MKFRGIEYQSLVKFSGEPRLMLCWNKNDIEPTIEHVFAYSDSAGVFITDTDHKIKYYECVQDFKHTEPEFMLNKLKVEENEILRKLNEYDPDEHIPAQHTLKKELETNHFLYFIVKNHLEFKKNYLLFKLFKHEIENIICAKTQEDLLDYPNEFHKLKKLYENEFGEYKKDNLIDILIGENK